MNINVSETVLILLQTESSMSDKMIYLNEINVENVMEMWQEGYSVFLALHRFDVFICCYS